MKCVKKKNKIGKTEDNLSDLAFSVHDDHYIRWPWQGLGITEHLRHGITCIQTAFISQAGYSYSILFSHPVEVGLMKYVQYKSN